MPQSIQVAAIPSMPFDENTYVLFVEGRRDCLVVDPGLEPEKILDFLAANDLTPTAILCTHGHADHIGGNNALKSQWPDCPILISKIDEPMLNDPQLNMSGPFGMPVTSPPADGILAEGENYRGAGLDLEVFAIPGHSPGHLVFVNKNVQPYHVLGGDVLFAGSVGRTDLPGGSFQQLADGIRRVLFALPDDTVVLPGHGPKTTVGREKKSNPFVGEDAGLVNFD